MVRLLKFGPLAAMVFSILACSLFTPASPVPGPVVTIAIQAPTEISTSTSPAAATDTPAAELATATQAPLSTTTMAATVLSSPSQPAATPSIVPTQSVNQLNACLNTLPSDMPTVEQGVTSGNTEGAHPLVSCDNFFDNTNGWDVGDWNGTYTQGLETLQAGVLSLGGTSKGGGIHYDYPANLGKLSNFALVVNAQFLSGPSTTKIAIMYRDNDTDYYMFEVSNTTYELSLYQNSTWTNLITPQPLPSGTDFTTQPGWIVVDVAGNVHTFYIDNQQVDMITDSSLSSGYVDIEIDLAASANGTQSKIAFYHFLLRGE